MTVIYLVLGILLVGLAFEYNRIIGAMLLIVIVLGFWLGAHRKGIV